LSRRNQRILSIFFKIAIVSLAFIVIFRRLNNNEDLRNFNDLIKTLPSERIYIIVAILILLMFLNWFIEALKWKFLVKNIERISLWLAVESVFCGLTWAIFTPNRIGEYGGRVFFLSPRKRIFGIIAMGIGGVGQLVITNVLGALALLWFIGKFVPLNFWLHYAIAFLIIIFCSFFLLFFFNIRSMIKILLSISFLKRFHRFFVIMINYPKGVLLKVFLYSLSRFIVFTSQYCLLIHLLVPEIQLFQMTMMIFILFFVLSGLPSLDLLDVGVRSMTATYFFSYITDQQVAIIAVTACIWLVNLVIPAILGTVFVLKLNFFGTNRN
jgi:hypothetical protein